MSEVPNSRLGDFQDGALKVREPVRPRMVEQIPFRPASVLHTNSSSQNGLSSEDFRRSLLGLSRSPNGTSVDTDKKAAVLQRPYARTFA